MSVFRERALNLDCMGRRLCAILSEPATDNASSGVGVVVVVGGPQYRAGSHRQFVLLARTLAANGHACLRFDYRGMGDAEGESLTFEATSPDIQAAIHALRREWAPLKRVVLWGLCDGASAILLHLIQQPNSADGLCLLNPWVRTDESLAKTQIKHYYTRRLLQREFWFKLMRGGMAPRALKDFFSNLHTAASRPAPSGGYQARMAAAWRNFPGPILLLLSGNDYVAKEFLDHATTDAAWVGLLERSGLSRQDLPGVDHTFSSAKHRTCVESLCVAWLAASFGGAEPS